MWLCEVRECRNRKRLQVVRSAIGRALVKWSHAAGKEALILNGRLLGALILVFGFLGELHGGTASYK